MLMRDLTGMTALVTGASRGIGLAIAEELASRKMNVVLCSRSKSKLDEVAQRLRGHGVRVGVIAADLSQREEVEMVARRATDLTGAVDILVNNAAMVCVLPFHRIHPDELVKEVFLNLSTPILLSRLLIPGMLSRGRGHIVTVSSVNADLPLPYQATYAATKAGLLVFATSLRTEYPDGRVSASAVLPGLVLGGGMIEEFEGKCDFRVPRSMGGCTPPQIAKALVRAVQKDLPEVIVHWPPPRPLLALGRLFPRLMEWVGSTFGLYAPGVAGGDLNLAQNGRLTGVRVSPDIDEQLAALKAAAEQDAASV
jgi:short-subunit dehydrogenase